VTVRCGLTRPLSSTKLHVLARHAGGDVLHSPGGGVTSSTT
jgi:hypothetical protein